MYQTVSPPNAVQIRPRGPPVQHLVNPNKIMYNEISPNKPSNRLVAENKIGSKPKFPNWPTSNDLMKN